MVNTWIYMIVYMVSDLFLCWLCFKKKMLVNVILKNLSLFLWLSSLLNLILFQLLVLFFCFSPCLYSRFYSFIYLTNQIHNYTQHKSFYQRITSKLIQHYQRQRNTKCDNRHKWYTKYELWFNISPVLYFLSACVI